MSLAASLEAPLDTLFEAETPEGIALALRPAGLVPRLLAAAVDFGVRTAVMIAASLALSQLKGVGGAIYLLLWFGMEWLYPVVFELLPGAATPGKRMLGLRVVMDTGLPVTPAAALVRNLLRTVDFLPFAYAFGLVAVLARRDCKRLGDVAAGTLVVHAERVSLHASLGEATPMAPAHALTLRQQAAVVAWAGRSRHLTAARAEELAQFAAPALPEGARRFDNAERLTAVARWLTGAR